MRKLEIDRSVAVTVLLVFDLECDNFFGWVSGVGAVVPYDSCIFYSSPGEVLRNLRILVGRTASSDILCDCNRLRISRIWIIVSNSFLYGHIFGNYDTAV